MQSFILLLVFTIFAVNANHKSSTSKSNSEWALQGLTSNFEIMGDTFALCDGTIGCYYKICTILQNSSFAALIALSENTDPFRNIQIPTNMIVLGINASRIIIPGSVSYCYNFYNCLNFGVKKIAPSWIVLAGQCFDY